MKPTAFLFETVKPGCKVPKKEFSEQEPELRTQLLEAQWALREAHAPLIIVVAGVEGAGKGEVVNHLNKWLDNRGVDTVAFWDETDEERERPRHWRFWRRLPSRGGICIMFGAWYGHLINERAAGAGSDADLDRELAHINALERMLTEDGALIVKFWFHLSRAAQAKRRRRAKKSQHTGPQDSPAVPYNDFVRVATHAVGSTNTRANPWHIIDAADRGDRDLTMGRALLATIDGRLHAHAITSAPPPTRSAAPKVLDRLQASPTLKPKEYRRQLKSYQARLNELGWAAWEQKRSSIVLLEGCDASGKGGAIRRLTAALDARLYHVIPVGIPSDEDRAHHYLWRFWRRIPRAGYMTIYDRSWYGRVLVERVEGLAGEAAWQRAYEEINTFEAQLCEHGTVLIKLFLHIDKDEQLRRFREREVTPWKQHKITAEDWRNRAKWDDYQAAANAMLTQTNTAGAPWTVIGADDKKYTRIAVLKTVCKRLEQLLDG